MVKIDSPPLTSLPKQLPNVEGSAWTQTWQSLTNPFDFLEKMRDRYGDIFQGEFLGFPKFVIISNPQAIEAVFAADPDTFSVGNSNKTINPIVGNNSLTQLDGAAHRRQRKLLMPPFHGERLRTYGQTITNIVDQVATRIPKGQPFLMRTVAQEITLRVILRTVFGLDEGDRFEELRDRLSTMLDGFNSTFGASLLFFPALQQDWGKWSPWGRFLQFRRRIDELIDAEIQDRKTQPPGEDILSLMMAARDEDGQPMTDLELRDELMTLLFGGHETTASALAWAFYWIHRDPTILQKLLDELEPIDDSSDPALIAKLPYLNAVCSETLRIYPVVHFTFGRMLITPMELMGYTINPGVILAPCIYLVHHDETLYPNPKQFRPERFLERQYTPIEFLPFGGGNRRCLGYAFALFEMKIVLARLLKQTSLGLVSDRPVKPMRRGVTFTPENGIPMVILNNTSMLL